MGQRNVPPYEDIYMSRKNDNIIEELAKHFIEGTENSLKLLKRYLDDIFLIFIGSTKKLHLFWQEVNKINPSK